MESILLVGQLNGQKYMPMLLYWFLTVANFLEAREEDANHGEPRINSILELFIFEDETNGFVERETILIERKAIVAMLSQQRKEDGDGDGAGWHSTRVARTKRNLVNHRWNFTVTSKYTLRVKDKNEFLRPGNTTQNEFAAQRYPSPENERDTERETVMVNSNHANQGWFM